jgi:biliverdin reductase
MPNTSLLTPEMTNYQINPPLRVGLVGTGYAAKRRIEAFLASPYANLMAVSGNKIENTKAFCETYNLQWVNSWHYLIENDNIDLICISNYNLEHSLIARAALNGNKHVIVEYPLALCPKDAEDLINLAKTKNKLLHVEHIEILGGVHQAIRQYLPQIGNPFLTNYTTIAPKNPAPRRWNYNYNQYGFPLIAALSRIHRFTDLFGDVKTVSCQAKFWDAPESNYFISCLCQAQLSFVNGLIANITYGKGEHFLAANRTLEIYGDQGKLLFEGEKGYLIKENKTIAIEVASRRGLFAKDTEIVLNHLVNNEPLYINNYSSFYALKVANAAFESFNTQTTIKL